MRGHRKYEGILISFLFFFDLKENQNPQNLVTEKIFKKYKI